MLLLLIDYFIFVIFALVVALMFFKLVYFVWCSFMGLIHRILSDYNGY